MERNFYFAQMNESHWHILNEVVCFGLPGIIKNQTERRKQWLSTQEIKAHKVNMSLNLHYTAPPPGLGMALYFASTTSGDQKAVIALKVASIIVFLAPSALCWHDPSSRHCIYILGEKPIRKPQPECWEY